MSVKEDIHSQIIDGLADATFPIETPEKLLAAFPAGADTTCKSGDVSVTAGEAGGLLKETDFPFKSAKEIADVIVERAGL
ncbi:MTH865 family protein [Methanolobus mangrovi]|uniref:MTH865 family protein n=1 Tax=Methanolobus mangrovi TaxID=3072977 RepID=A0AA51YGP8_9EURY|nr:MTH865 family protein [Methanolobus mangrovi]WMW22306.1 MTH865 family protein [Methanolobus mangrovi]